MNGGHAHAARPALAGEGDAASSGGSFLALSGGVGGAKLALGLARALAIAGGASQLTIVANTGDDFEHLGLSISPDLDSLMYTLAGVADPERGWGRAGETWNFLAGLGELGNEAWFRLGDKDLAVHVLRSHRLAKGDSLSHVTASFCRALGVHARLVPMSDDPVRTIVLSSDGELPFQEYFVRRRCEPKVTGFRYEGAASARPSAGLIEALDDPNLKGVIFCPSNPFVSTGPILALPGVEARLRELKVPVVAVSPIVGGDAVKGPLAKMMRELGLGATAVEVARCYVARGLLDGFVLDTVDGHLVDDVSSLGPRAIAYQTVMRSLEDRVGLARQVIDFTLALGQEG
jgi:LPPG:FO 2-phospho-L-lactate transferase